MQINILKEEKDEMDIEIDNLTIVEILRTYLNRDSEVSLAAWRREHFQKPAVLKIKTKGKTAKKALDDAISLIQKEAEKLAEEVKNSKVKNNF